MKSGIDLPQRRVDDVRRELERKLATLDGVPKTVVFGCACAADVDALARDDTATLSLECAAMLSPSFIDYALRAGADGVLVTGCRDGDCAYRLGNELTEARLQGTREPHLRASVPRERVRVAWRGPWDGQALRDDLEAFRAALRLLPATPRPASKRKVHHG